MLAAAARANVAVYTFDPRGLRHINPDGLGGNGAEVSAAVLADNRTRILRAATLHELAERTGGGASVDSNDTLTLLARVAHESSHYYLLGYTPTDARRDGRFHSLDVRRPPAWPPRRRAQGLRRARRRSPRRQGTVGGERPARQSDPPAGADRGSGARRPGGRLSVGGRTTSR